MVLGWGSVRPGHAISMGRLISRCGLAVMPPRSLSPHQFGGSGRIHMGQVPVGR